MIITEIEKAVPPTGLVRQCVAVADMQISTNRQLVDDRNNWKKAFCECAAKHDRLVQWNIDVFNPPIAACI